MVGGDSLDRPWEGFFEGDFVFTWLIEINHNRSQTQILAKLSISRLTSPTSRILSIYEIGPRL